MSQRPADSLTRKGVPDSRRLVVTARDNLPAIGTERNGIHQTVMLQDEMGRLAAGRVPNLGLTVTGSGQAPSIGAEDEAAHRRLMRQWFAGQIARRRIP